MTSGGPPAGRSPWPVAAWAMVGLTIVALAVAVVGNVVSRAIVLDAIALWPLAALALPAAILGIRGGRRRALAPLMVLTWLLLSVGIHLSGVAGMPSTSATVSAEIDVPTARLTVALPDAAVEVGAGGFAVQPLPLGGTAGVPVVERVTGTAAVALVVTEDPDRSPWHRYGGFRVTLPSGVSWDLRIEAGSVDLDLGEVAVGGGRIEARTGRVTLGMPTDGGVLEISGDVEVSVPEGVAVEVIGSERVPDDWVTTEDGLRSPVEGDGWTIRATSGSVRIVTR